MKNKMMDSFLQSFYDVFNFNVFNLSDADPVSEQEPSEDDLMIKIDGTFFLLNDHQMRALRTLKAQLYAHAKGKSMSNYHPDEHYLIGAKTHVDAKHTEYVQIRADEIIEPNVVCARLKSETGAVLCLVNKTRGSVPVGLRKKDSERTLRYDDIDAIFSCLKPLDERKSQVVKSDGAFDTLTMVFS